MPVVVVCSHQHTNTHEFIVFPCSLLHLLLLHHHRYQARKSSWWDQENAQYELVEALVAFYDMRQSVLSYDSRYQNTQLFRSLMERIHGSCQWSPFFLSSLFLVFFFFFPNFCHIFERKNCHIPGSLVHVVVCLSATACCTHICCFS
jgi:hypothetical protein